MTATPTCACPVESISVTTKRCHCPLKTTVTKTDPPATCNCPVQTIVPTTVTRYGTCNTTSQSAPIAGTGTGTSTGTAAPSPTCSLSELPNYFFLQTAPRSQSPDPGNFLAVHPTAEYHDATVGHPLSDATPFIVHTTNDGSIDGIEQLAFASRNGSNTTVINGAWIRTVSTGNYGSPIEFFDIEKPPGNGWGIVTASFSTYLCQLSLVSRNLRYYIGIFGLLCIKITWGEHDLSYPLQCEAELWLNGGFNVPAGYCASVRVIVSTGID